MNISGSRVPFQARAMQLPSAPIEEQPKVEETAVEEQPPVTEEKTEEAPTQAVETVGTPSYLAQMGIKIVSPVPTGTPTLETPATETPELETPVEEPEAPVADADQGGSSSAPDVIEKNGKKFKDRLKNFFRKVGTFLRGAWNAIKKNWATLVIAGVGALGLGAVGTVITKAIKGVSEALQNQ